MDRKFNTHNGAIRPRRSILFHFLYKSIACISLLSIAQTMVIAEEMSETVAREILAFYDGKQSNEIDNIIFRSSVHQSAEMPLNHLGLKVRYHDLRAPLPSAENMRGVRGILLWLHTENVPKPNALLRWLITQMDSGKPVVVMGSHAFEYEAQNKKADPKLIKQFWSTLGLENNEEWALVTYDLELKHRNEKITEYERTLNGSIPQFPLLQVKSGESSSYLQANQTEGSKIADIVAIGPNGGYIAPSYAQVFSLSPSFESGPQGERESKYWYINPFRFFALAFHTKGLPKPDTTTLAGRRIYYSHIDGDGWRNISLIPHYREHNTSSAEVILNEIFLEYPNLPVTVAPIAADLDSNWFGSEKSQQVAREIYALPYIEAASHTYSHPLYWGFFEDYKPENEEAYRELYPKIPTHYNVQGGIRGLFKQAEENHSGTHSHGKKLKPVEESQAAVEDYITPRAYYNGPYDLQEDIEGSINYIASLLPEGKQVKLFQWSGNTLAFNSAIKMTRDMGVRNLNGGDTRFDAEYDSINWVSPIGRTAGGEQQIYASASNENTYTKLWNDRFYGHSYLTETFKRTESPIRLKPMNIYYHFYTGELQASLASLKNNLEYAQSKTIAPITASQFAAIGDGFFNTELEKLGEGRWRILNRGKLQTIRFDQATFSAVDFANSEGVIGQSHLQGSLYVALDPQHRSPVISLKNIELSDQEPKSKQPYLISSRWWVEAFEISKAGFQFKVEGFGEGHMSWYIPASGNYKIIVEHADGEKREWSTQVGEDHWLDIQLLKSPIQASTVKILRESNHNAGA